MEVRTLYSGLTVNNGGAVIEKVVDSVSSMVNKCISLGKVLTIIGKKIRVVTDEAPLKMNVLSSCMKIRVTNIYSKTRLQ